MLRVIIATALILFTSNVALAQSPSFEVATIKPAEPPTTVMGAGGGMKIGIRMGTQGGPGTSDPGQITYSNLPLKALIVNAYGVKSYQVSGPNWMDTERFDIVAKVPKGSTKDDVKLMLQSLLAERFQLTLHHEKKDLPMYALVIGKNGPKMKESPPEDPKANVPAGGPADDAAQQKAKQTLDNTMRFGGMPQLPPPSGPGMRMMMQPGRMHLMANRQTMTQFAESLSNQMDRPVVDQTGLTKIYDFTLDFAPDGAMGKGMLPTPPPGDGAGGPEPETLAPSLVTALPEQLGLKLEQKKGSVDLLVVDHLEKAPTGN